MVPKPKAKYKHLKNSQFAGTIPRTFPVDTPLRARAALAYRRFDPDPEGLRLRVLAIAKRKGWLKDGRIKIK